MAEYWESDELQELAERLIAEFHPHLASPKIAYLFRDKAAVKKLSLDGEVTQVVWGKFSKMGGGKYEVLTHVDLVLEFGYDMWQEYSDMQRRYAVDTLLSTMAGDEGPTGEAKLWIIPYPVQAFPDVVVRHGLPFDDLRDMARIMRDSYMDSNAVILKDTEKTLSIPIEE